MAAVTKEHMDHALKFLRHEATEAGLMDAEDILIYDRGVRAGGVPPALYVGRRGDHCTFLPRFTTDTTQREVLLVLEAVTFALRTLRLNQLGDQ